MKRTPDVELVLRDYLADDGLTAPDFILDVVEARIGRQPQRRGWPFLRRTNVTRQFKLIAGLAAALVVAVVGYNLLPGRSGPGTPTTAPTASAQPTSVATAAPTPSATFAYPSGILPPGSHATASFLPAFTFTLSEPWVLDGDTSSYYSLFPDSTANRAEWARTGNPANGILIASDLERPWFV